MIIAVPRRDDPDAPGGAAGEIVRVDAPELVVATAVPGNPLAAGWSPPSGVTGRLIAWSGTLADELFAPHPFTWLRPGHEALTAFCDGTGGTLDLVLHPHARHVLNDARSCATFLNDRAGRGPGVALAPASLLEPSMLEDVEDHLTRMFQTLGPIADLVVLAGAEDLPRDLVRFLLRECVPPNTPIIIPGDRLEHWPLLRPEA